MDNEIDAALMSTTEGQIGGFIGGFIIPMLISYILLRIAGSPKRKPGTAATLRIASVAIAAFLVYLGYIGGGNRLEFGSIFALVVTTVWAATQHKKAHASKVSREEA